MRRTSGALCGLILVACASEGKPTTVSGRSFAASPITQGVPHVANIDMVVVARDGTSAITRDAKGGVRLWPNLAGAQPIPVPLPETRHFSLAGSPDRGWTIAAVDSAGSVRVVRRGSAGINELMATSPHREAKQIELLPDTEHALILFADHRIQLVKVDGTVLATIERRQFRPQRIHLARDGKSFRVSLIEETNDKQALTLQRYHITLAARPYLRRGRAVTTFEIPKAVTEQRSGLSPSTRRFAFLERVPGHKMPWSIVLVNPDTGSRRLVSSVPAGIDPTLDFVDEDRLMVSSPRTGQSWVVEIVTGRSWPRPAPPAHLAFRGHPQGFGGDIRIMGVGLWLYVQRVASGTSKYLGFAPFLPIDADISPSGKRALWIVGGAKTYVESLRGGPTIRVQGNAMAPDMHGFFLDEEHIVLLVSTGGLRLVRWADGRQVATADAGGPTSLLAKSVSRKLLAVRHTNNKAVWVYEVSKKGFTGPYIITDESEAHGLLASRGPSDPVLWTLDRKNTWRTYTLSELRSGVTRTQMATRGTVLPGSYRAPSSVDARGTRFELEERRGQFSVVLDGPGSRTGSRISLAQSLVSRVETSPDGARFAVLGHKGVLTMYDRASGRARWSYSFQRAATGLVWSADSKLVTGFGQTGAAILSASTGTVVHASCGPMFEVRASPPVNPFAGTQLGNLCELEATRSR